MHSIPPAQTFFPYLPAIIFLLIGSILAIMVFVFTLMPGTQGPNHYGPDPYGESDLEEVFA